MNVKESLSVLDKAYQSIFWVVLIVLAVLLFMCLIRAIKGPRVADRLVAVNMMGTMVMVMITVLALLLKESYLLDIGLIYAMVSFLAVVMLSKVYIGIYEEKVRKKENSIYCTCCITDFTYRFGNHSLRFNPRFL